MANSYGVAADELRKACNNISSTRYTDGQLVTISEQKESLAHKRLGRSSAYSSSSETDKYKIMQGIIKNGVRSEVLGSLDNYSEIAKKAEEKFDADIQMIKSTGLSILTGGPNITDELNPDNYTPEASTTY